MVQSRIKAVEKMDAEAPEPVEIDAVWRFSIPNSEPLGPPIIAVNDVSFDYSPVRKDGSKKPESEYLLQKVNFGVDLTSRIAILGANGQGKVSSGGKKCFTFQWTAWLTIEGISSSYCIDSPVFFGGSHPSSLRYRPLC